MEEIKSTAILEFNENQMENVRKSHGYEDTNKLIQDIEQLNDWVLKQNHFTVKRFDQGYLERLLIYNKGSTERTKQKLDKLCTFVNLMPDFLQNFDIQNEFRAVQNVINICMLPKPTKENYRVYIEQTTAKDDNKFQFIDYCRYSLIIAHYILCNDYCNGLEIIMDTRHITYSLITKMNPITLNKAATLFTEGMSQRMKKIHLLSGSKFLDIILKLLKQSLSAKLNERIIVHSNVESLYEHIPREQLPEDFGGDEKSVLDISRLNFEEFSSDDHIKAVKFMETTATNESLRLISKFNEEYSGMPGSFKTLCID